MTARRKLYTGEETAGRGLLLLRLASVGALTLTALFIILFDRAKHDPGLARVNPFAEDPYDSVGSFGVQTAIVCATISAIRAFRTDLKTESLYNRYTYTLRAIAVSQLAIIVTMLSDMVALVRYTSLWDHSPEGDLLVAFTGGLLLLSSGFCLFVIRLANRRKVCSQNPLRPRQTVLLLIVLGLLGIYPGAWREGLTGAILTAALGMVFLFYLVTLLSKAMFPCPDVPEKDLIDDLQRIYRSLKPRSGYLARVTESIGHSSSLPWLRKVMDFLNPRKHEWNLLALMAILVGFLLALVDLFSGGPSPGVGQAILVTVVFVILESAGVFLGYALLRRFLGLIRVT